MMIQEELFAYQDIPYRDFQSPLVPGIDRDTMIGVRIPNIRKIARKYKDTKEEEDFLNSLPHKYYEENILHGILISEMKDYEKTIEYLEQFAPYIDNWAVCDTISPICFKKCKKGLISRIRKWARSKKPYTIRLGIEMLMKYYLGEDYKKEYLDIPSSVKSDHYYVKMMIAWFFATSLVDHWDDSIKILEEKRLDKWTHNKTIQKAIESFRITDEQKEALRKMKI